MVSLATIRAVITFKERKFDMAKICQIIITFVAAWWTEAMLLGQKRPKERGPRGSRPQADVVTLVHV
jgi:hypothetical protein